MKSKDLFFEESHFSMNCKGHLVDLTVPKIMGILNITPDSFSDGGQFIDENSALIHTEKMIKEGADIIDIGPQSTRPNATFLKAEEEIQRLGNLISKIKTEFPEMLISIDTFYSKTVEFAYNEGADLINDISGGQFDEKMFETAGKTKLPYILMHNNASWGKMHQTKTYPNIIVEINSFFSKKVEELKAFGVQDILLDPGFGFGKTIEDQQKMIEESAFFGFGRLPVLVGVSRKSFIYKPLGKSPLEVNEETQKIHLKVLENGAKILRVHEVAATKKVLNDFLKTHN